MINVIKSFITQSTISPSQLRKWGVAAVLLPFALLLLAANIYIYNISFSFVSPSSTIEEETSEDTEVVVTIKKGDTLNGILKKQNLSNDEIQKITSLAKNHNLTALKVGKTITFEYNITLIEDEGNDLATEEKNISAITFEIDGINSVNIIKSGDNFVAQTSAVPLTKLIAKYEATVDSNVISCLKKAGLSANSIVNLINVYSHQIDFQRQIQPGDKITVVTEKFVTPESKLSHHGEIIYASIETQGQEYKIYRYSPTGKKENYEFFSYDGQSTKSTLLKTPINVARISSNFGYRSKHPIHGYGAMHKGVDFSAPVGTPIYAAGTGTVEFVGWKSGYGKMVVINHHNGISTAYAHASRFANNLKRGSKVKQGETIAFVGTTGHVTGAHLHYEVRQNGKHINPAKFKSTPAVQLKGGQLAKFNRYKNQISKLEYKLSDTVEMAAHEISEVDLF